MLTVTVEDGKLMVQATNQKKYQVFAESSTRFFYKVVDAQISFAPVFFNRSTMSLRYRSYA